MSDMFGNGIMCDGVINNGETIVDNRELLYEPIVDCDWNNNCGVTACDDIRDTACDRADKDSLDIDMSDLINGANRSHKPMSWFDCMVDLFAVICIDCGNNLAAVDTTELEHEWESRGWEYNEDDGMCFMLCPDCIAKRNNDNADIDIDAT